MSRESYTDYLDAFNRSDFERLERFLCEDAVFEHLPHLPQLKGRKAILDFYRSVHELVSETVTPVEIFVDDHGIAAEISTRFVAKQDWGAFPSAPLKSGDVYTMSGVVFYWTAQGRFRRIRGVARLTATLQRSSDGTVIDLLRPQNGQFPERKPA